MNVFRFALILTTLMLVGGCELTGSTGDDRIGSSGGSTVDGEVAGRAVKGVLGQALVQAYAVEAGGLRWIAETSTDANGYYRLTLEGIRGPVLLEVSASPGASMRCDGVSGCGTAAFGEEVALAEGFRLSTVILPREIGSEQAAITPLTHLAAEWVRDLDTVPSAEMVRLARSRVAGVLSVAPDFAMSQVPDITSEEEMAASDAGAVGNAVMAAAFQEASSDWGEGFLADVVHRFKAHGGQLHHTGDGGSLKSLLDAASRVARQAKGNTALPSMAASLEFRRDHLEPGITTFQEPMLDTESPAFRDARTTIEGIVAALDDFGINGSGDFADMRMEEMSWLANQETAMLLGQFTQLNAQAWLVSMLADLTPGDNVLDTIEGITFRRFYVENRAEVHLSGQGSDLLIEMPLARQVLAEREPLEYRISGVMAAGAMRLEVDSTMVLDPLDSNPMPMIIALDTAIINGQPITWEEFVRETEEFVENLHGRMELSGKLSLARTQGDFRELSANGNVRLEVDLRNLDGAPDIIDLTVAGTQIEDPYGRTLGSSAGEPLLHLRVDEDLTLKSTANLIDKGRPLLGFEYGMTLPGAGESFTRGGLALVSPGPETRVSLQLDFPRRLSGYRVEHSDNELRVRRSDSTGTAFVLRNPGPGGGAIYAKGELMGTFLLDVFNNRACFLLMDGSRHCLSSGTNEEMSILPERQLLGMMMQ